MIRTFGAIILLALVAVLAACEQEDPKIKLPRDCATSAGRYLEPAWAPRTVVVDPTFTGFGARVKISAQGHTVTVECGAGQTMGGPVINGVTVEGKQPDPGQIYLAVQGRWLTPEELRTRIHGILAIRPGEFAGQPWKPGVFMLPPDYDKSPAVDECFNIRSRDNEYRALTTCPLADGRHYWMGQDQIVMEVEGLPEGVGPIPPSTLHPPGSPAKPAG